MQVFLHVPQPEPGHLLPHAALLKRRPPFSRPAIFTALAALIAVTSVVLAATLLAAAAALSMARPFMESVYYDFKEEECKHWLPQQHILFGQCKKVEGLLKKSKIQAICYEAKWQDSSHQVDLQLIPSISVSHKENCQSEADIDLTRSMSHKLPVPCKIYSEDIQSNDRTKILSSQPVSLNSSIVFAHQWKSLPASPCLEISGDGFNGNQVNSLVFQIPVPASCRTPSPLSFAMCQELESGSRLDELHLLVSSLETDSAVPKSQNKGQGSGLSHVQEISVSTAPIMSRDSCVNVLQNVRVCTLPEDGSIFNREHCVSSTSATWQSEAPSIQPQSRPSLRHWDF